MTMTLPAEFQHVPHRDPRGSRAITWPDFAAGTTIEAALGPLKAEHARLGKDLREVRLQLDGAQQARGKAAREDNLAYSAAIRDGKPDPGAKAAQEVERVLLEARRRGDAILTARAAIEREAEDVLRQDGSNFQSETLATVEAQRTVATAALAALEGAIQGMQAARSLGFWVANPRRKAAAPTPYLDGLRNTANEPTSASHVIAALAGWLDGAGR